MSLKDMLVMDGDVFFNTSEFAEVVVYTPDSGPSSFSITVVITDGVDPTLPDTGRSLVAAAGVMRVKRSDFVTDKPKGIIVRDDGSSWTIGRELSCDAISRKVEIRSKPRASFKG